MPELIAVNHVGLTVRDLDVSKAWYRDLLGFEITSETAADSYRLAIMEKHGLPFSVGLFQMNGNDGQAFDSGRTGLNHLAFTVASRDDLDKWAERFIHLGVEHSEIHDSINGWVLIFRDPDNIALEVYFPHRSE